MSSQTLDSMLMCSKPENEQHQQQEKKPRPADEQALKCPRCDSPNTKFCYYNNYSLTQPRYFCKSCRRYWTKGGTLRNVPVGGGCRKNRRSSSLSSRRTTTPEYHIQVQQSDHGLMANHCSPYDHSNNNNNNNSHHHLAALAAQNGGGGANNNISLLRGSHGSSNFDLFGGYPSGNSFLETLRGGLVQYDNNILYYGLDNAGGHGVNMSQGHEDSPHDPRMQLDHQHQEIISNPSSGSSTPRMKQEMGENNNKMLWSFPWQLNGEGNYYMNGGGSGNHELDLVKENWNSAIVGVGSTWNNNLLHSPLM